ncbi:MAG: hypothetical protein R3F56_21405 [Planctomycetota bacterium]
MRTTPAVLIPLLACVATPRAQQRTLVLPSAFERVYGRGSSAALGGSSTRTQMIFASPFPANTTVMGVGLRGAGATTDKAAFTADIEVHASSTTSAPGALSSTFANNIGTDEVAVLPRQMVNVLAMPANRSTAMFSPVPFQAPFVFGTNSATNINIDLWVYGRSTGASWSTDRCFASASGTAATVGQGCGAGTITSTSANGTYVGGSTLTVSLAGGTANGSAWLMPSTDMAELVPGFPLPFDLGLIGGATGCAVQVSPLMMIPTPTDGTGAATISLPVGPIGGLDTAWQWLYTVPPSGANPLGVEATATRKIFFGPEVCVPSAQYVWDLSNVNATTGTSTTDAVPIVQFTVQ